MIPDSVQSYTLMAYQAKALIQSSERGPYGRGEATIVDPQVRQT